MNKGTVKWFNDKKGYGFIKMEDGTDIFVHHTGINMEGYRRLSDCQGVEFDIIETEKGKQAVNVTVVEPIAEIIVEIDERDTVINKILEQYGEYGITKDRVENLYDSGIGVGVPEEIIYFGIKLMFNCEFGLDNAGIAEEIGEGFGRHYIKKTRKANLPTTDEGLVKRFVDDIEEFLKEDILPITSQMKVVKFVKFYQ